MLQMSMSKLSLKVLFGVFALMFSGVGDVVASDLPDCPPFGPFHNCFGTKTYSFGEYVGEWKDNKFNGQGTFTYRGGVQQAIGQWKDGDLNGQGTIIFGNGEKFVGEFTDGKMNGKGAHTFPSGLVQEGIWKDNEFQYPQN